MVPCYWSRSNKPKAKPRKCDTHGPRPLLEWLEDRLLPSATLVVVANSYPTDAFHFHTLQDALVAAAGSPDIIQVEPGADPGIFNSTTLAAAAKAGDQTIITNDPISPRRGDFRGR